MANLRPRVDSFNPARRVQTPGGGGGDTFTPATVDAGGFNAAVGDLQALRAFSPSLNNFLERGHKAFLNRLQAEADVTVGKLTPEQVRAESMAKWEAYSKQSGVDNAWWKIILDEAGGRKVAQEYATALVSRSLEATDPHDPQAHLKILDEEKAKATQGLGFYALAQFEKESASATALQGRRWAEQREQRVQAAMDEDFDSTLRGNIRQQSDPDRGGDVDLSGALTAVQDFHERTGESGRPQLLKAINDAVTVGVGNADSTEQLDDFGLQMRAVIADAGELPLGPNGQPLDSVSGLELDGAQQRLDSLLESRELTLKNREANEKNRTDQKARSIGSALSIRVYTGELTRDQAEEELAKQAEGLSGDTNFNADDLTATAMLTFRSNSSALEAGKYVASDDPVVAAHLFSTLAEPNFDSAAFETAVLGAAEDRKLSAKTVFNLLSASGDTVKRAIVTASEQGAAAPLSVARPFFDSATEPLVSEVVGDTGKASVSAFLADQWSIFEGQEKASLAAEIEKAGVGQEAAAIATWKQGLNQRQADFAKTAMDNARAAFQGGIGGGDTSVDFNPARAFEVQVRADKQFDAAESNFVEEYVRQQFEGKEDEASAIFGDASGGLIAETDPIGSLAALVASGAGSARNGRAAALQRDGKAAFMAQMVEQAQLSEGGVDINKAAEKAKASWNTAPIVGASKGESAPKPGDAPPPKPQGEVESELSAAAIGFKSAADSEKKLLDSGAPKNQLDAAAERTKESYAEFSKARDSAWNDNQRIIDVLARHGDIVEFLDHRWNTEGAFGYGKTSIYRQGGAHSVTREQFLGKGDFESYRGVKFRNGHVWLKEPVTSFSWRTFGQKINLEKTDQRQKDIEAALVGAKLYLGVTPKEVKDGMVAPYPGATEEEMLAFDSKLVNPRNTPLFRSEAELDGTSKADLEEIVAMFPGWSAEALVAVQRKLILERIPESADTGGKPLASGKKPVFPGGDFRSVTNQDGTVSNIVTATVGIDNKTYVIPTMVAGKRLSVEEATKVAEKNGLELYPSFSSEAAALDFSRSIHDKVDEKGFLK